MLRTLAPTSTFLRSFISSSPLRYTYRTAMSFPYKPNTEPPKDMTVFKNIVSVASSSDKFRRVLWTGRNSQVSVSSLLTCIYAEETLYIACDHDRPCER